MGDGGVSIPLGPREAGALRVMRGGRLGRMVDEEEASSARSFVGR